MPLTFDFPPPESNREGVMAQSEKLRDKDATI